MRRASRRVTSRVCINLSLIMSSLIEAVRKHPCLWDTDSSEYKHGSSKDHAWAEVVRQCGLPNIKEAKATWRRLRDGHRQAITRESTRGVPWKYEKSMAFLLPFIKRRTSTSRTKSEYWYADKNDEEITANVESGEDEIPNYEYASTSGLNKEDGKVSDPALEKFFTSMLLTTTQLPERLQLRVQRQVFNIVMEAREEHIANTETDTFD